MDQPACVDSHERDAAEREDGSVDGRRRGTTVLFRRGFSKTSLQAGTQIVIDGYRAKDGTNKMNARETTFADGRRLFAGSEGTGAPR